MSFPVGPHNRRGLTAEPPSDQRRSRRFRATLPVDLTQGTTTRRVESVDVSRHGIFVAVDNPPPLRFLVRVSIQLPDGPLVANAFVSRRQTDTEPQGAGLQFFAMATQAKSRWDLFVGRVSGLHARTGRTTRPGDYTPRPPIIPTPEASSFMVKLPNIDRLEAFFDRAVWTRSVYMVTPLIRPLGTPVSVVLIHPISSDEFTLGGIISRVRTDSPKGIEIQLDAISEDTRRSFAMFILQRERRTSIPTGHTPVPEFLSRPPPAHAPPPIISAGEPTEQPITTPTPLPMEPPVEHPQSFIARGSSPPSQGLPSISTFPEPRRPTLPPARPTPAPMPPGSVPPPRAISSTADTLDLEDTTEDTKAISIDLSAFPPVDESSIDDEHRFEWGTISDDLIIDLDLSEFDTAPKLEEVEEISGEEMMEAARSSAPPPLSAVEPQPSFEARISMIVEAPHSCRVACGSCGRDDQLAIGPASGPIGLFAEHRVFWCRKCKHAVAVPRLINPRARIDLKEKLPPGTMDGARAIELAASVAELAQPPRCPRCDELLRTNRETKALEQAIKRNERTIRIERIPCSKCGSPALTLFLL